MALEKKYTEHRKLIKGENDLLTWCNDHGEQGQAIIKEWDASKNGSMEEYKAGSGKRVYWVCSICNEPYIKEVRERILGKLHEPCGRKLGREKLKQYHKDSIPFKGSLAGKYPDLLKEWDYESNKKLGCEPEHVSAYSAKEVYWICGACKNKWKMRIRQRTIHKSGCRACRKKLKDRAN